MLSRDWAIFNIKLLLLPFVIVTFNVHAVELDSILKAALSSVPRIEKNSYYLKGRVVELRLGNNIPVKQVTVELLDEGKVLDKTVTDLSGEFNFSLKRETNYFTIKVLRTNGYCSKKVYVSSSINDIEIICN